MMLESDGPGGAEYVLLQLSEELRRQGHVVYPFGPDDGTGWLAGRFRDLGFEPQLVRQDRPVDPGCARRLAEQFRRLAIDVVHSHEFTMAVYGAAAARWSGRRHIITFHGNQTMTRALRRRMAIRWAMRRSVATTAVSGETRRQLVEDLGVAADAIQVIRNGVPIRPGDRARIRQEFGLRDEEILVLAVGNLEKRKGHLILLEALRRVRAEAPETPWRLIIAGGRGGVEQEPIETFIREHGMERRVHLLLRREDVPDLQAAADLFVMPSLWEGLPLALLEAMLAGKPIIASATSGIPEAVEGGHEGLLTPPGDAGALAGALARLLHDPAERRRLGQAARARGEREFTVGVMADAYLRLFRDDPR
jgi:glycosyltransferase involved in cell wall biosynthesis